MVLCTSLVKTAVQVLYTVINTDSTLKNTALLNPKTNSTEGNQA